MTDRQARIAADTARFIEHMAAAAAGDPYAKTNAAAYRARLERLGAPIPTIGATVAPTREPATSSSPSPIVMARPTPPLAMPSRSNAEEDELVAAIASFLPPDRRASDTVTPIAPITEAAPQRSTADAEADRLAAEIAAWLPREEEAKSEAEPADDVADEIAAFLPPDRRKKV